MEHQFGDIIAVRSNSILSRAIRYFTKGKYSHAAVVINVWGNLWIAEALGWGFRIWPIEQSGYLTDKNTMILRHKQGFTEQQIEDVSKKMVSLGGTRYQYENFFQWILWFWAKINVFKRVNERSLYCSEAAAIAIDTAYPGTFPYPNMVNTQDHITSGIYDLITR